MRLPKKRRNTRAVDSLNLNRPKILVVEDGSQMSQLLNQALTESGYSVTLASNGYEGLRMVQDQDLAIIDVMMPIMNGLEMIRRLRSEGLTLPVIFLTARDSPGDFVKGLDLGADDYVAKPFRLEELLARVRAHLRRARLAVDVLSFADVWMDTKSRRVKRGEHVLALANNEFEILRFFLIRPGEIVTKEVLSREMWGEKPRGDNVLAVYINYLRTKLEARGENRLIHTVHGQGYVLGTRAP